MQLAPAMRDQRRARARAARATIRTRAWAIRDQDPNYKNQTCNASLVCSGGVQDIGNTFWWGRNDSAQAGKPASNTPLIRRSA